MKQQLLKCAKCGTENSNQRIICFNCHENLREIQNKKNVSEDSALLEKRKLTKGKEILPDSKIEKKQNTDNQSDTKTKNTQKCNNKKSAFINLDQFIYVPSLKQRIQMYRQFHSLLKAGIPLVLTMSYIEKNISYTIKPAMREIGTAIEKGGLLSEQAVNYPAIFAEWEISMIIAGERSGNLPEVMDEISTQLEIELLMKTEISSKTWHLKATAVVTILVGLILSNLMNGGGAILNMLFSSALTTCLIVGVIIAAIVLTKRFTATKAGGIVAYNVMSRMPMYGPILKNQSILRFVNVLSAMVHAGIGPIESLQTAANATGNQVIIARAQESSKRLGSGESLTDVVKSMNMLPPETIYLIKTGEDSGSLVEALKKTGEYIQMELTNQVKTMPAKLMLLVYFFISFVVGYILVVGYQQYAIFLNSLMTGY